MPDPQTLWIRAGATLQPKSQALIEDVMRVQVGISKRDFLILLKALHFPSVTWFASNVSNAGVFNARC